MKNILLGAAVGYNVAALHPFISSLRHTRYKGRTVLFVDDIDNTALGYLQTQGIETISFKPTRRPLYLERFFLYKSFLDQEQGIGHVMLTDVRDVFFQNDPFSFCSADTLYCFEEDRSIPFVQCPVNSSWMLHAYGIKGLDVIEDNAILCAGVTIGSYGKVLEYLQILCKELVKLPPLWGIDQAAHNFLIRSGMISSSVIYDNESGPVYTLALVNPEHITIDLTGCVINNFGIPSVLHQYDRHPVLVEMIRNKNRIA